jgi:hypothetical protein
MPLIVNPVDVIKPCRSKKVLWIYLRGNFYFKDNQVPCDRWGTRSVDHADFWDEAWSCCIRGYLYPEEAIVTCHSKPTEKNFISKLNAALKKNGYDAIVYLFCQDYESSMKQQDIKIANLLLETLILSHEHEAMLV